MSTETHIRIEQKKNSTTRGTKPMNVLTKHRYISG
jgi:hypothetical protein